MPFENQTEKLNTELTEALTDCQTEKLGDDRTKIAAFLEETERSLTDPLDFRADMTASAQRGENDA